MKSTVDGYAVRAADTYGASDGLPSYLDLLGAVRMGAAPEVAVRPGGCVAMPTGGVLPDGADAVVMVEYTAETMPGTIEITRPVAPGGGLVRADEDVAVGAPLVPAGRPLRAPDLGLLAAAGVTTVAVHARPRVAIISTGDEVVPPSTVELPAGQVRDATASALAGLVLDAGGEPVIAGIVSDEPGALKEKLTEVLPDADLVVVSAGSSVGARDETAGAVAAVGSVWCHGLAIKPGKPTLLADCGGIPLIGLPGNPLSALVVFGQVGVPLLWRLSGCENPPPAPSTRARLSRDLASAAGGSTWSRSSCATAWPSRCSARPRCCPCSPVPTATWSCRNRRPGSTPAPRSRSRCTDEQPVRLRRPRGRRRTPPGGRPVPPPAARRGSGSSACRWARRSAG